MKAKNSEKIIRGYLEFAGGLLISTALSMALLTGFIHTNESEYKLMFPNVSFRVACLLS